MKIIDGNTNGIGGSATEKSKGIRSVLLTTALMMGLTSPFVWAYARTNSGLYDRPDSLWLILFLCVGMAGAGTIRIRVAHLSWRQIVLAAVLAGAGFMLLAMLKFPPFLGLWSMAEFYSSPIEMFLFGTLFIGSPVFLLALFDPAVRSTLHSFTVWKVVVTALLIMVPFLLFDLAGISYNGDGAGKGGREIGTFVSYLLLFIGTIIVLRLPLDERGPRLGGIGILLRLLFLIIWTVFGTDGSL